MNDRLKANVSRLSAMRVDESVSVAGATITRPSHNLWTFIMGERRAAFNADLAALFLTALEDRPRVVEFAIGIKAYRKLPSEAKSRASELNWHRCDDTGEFVSGPLPPALAQPWREKLAGIAADERDLTSAFVLGVTNASSDYDGFGTTEIMLLGEGRLVAMRKEHASTWQLPMYGSGLKVCELVD